MFLADDLESIAEIRQRADRLRLHEEQAQTEKRLKVTRWRQVLCIWPFLPLLPALIRTDYTALFIFFFVLLLPTYAAWTAFGSIAAGIGVHRRVALARIALATNLPCFVASCTWLAAAYTGRVNVSF